MAPKRRKFFSIFHRQRKATSPQRAFVTGVASVLLVVGLAAALIRPVPANAQFVVSDPGSLVERIVRNIVDAGRYIADKTAELAKNLYKKAGDAAFKNAMRVFLGKIAEDTATWIASGAKGQGPLFITDPNYFKNLGNAAAGDFLDTLSKEQFGVSMCDPGFAKLNIDIALRVNLDPNFCQENCQKNYSDQLELVEGGKSDNLRNLGAELSAFEALISDITTREGARCAATSLKSECDADAWTQNLGRCEWYTDPSTGAASCREHPDAAWDPPMNYGGNEAREKTPTIWSYCSACGDGFLCIKTMNECRNKIKDVVQMGSQADANLKLCINKCTSAKTRRTTSCTLSAIGDNIQSGLAQSSISVGTPLGSRQATGASLQQAFEKGDLPKIFKPTENPLGQFLTLYDEAQEKKVEAEKKEKDTQLFGGALPIKALISGAIKTPSFLTKKTTEEGLSTQNASKSETTQTGSPIADAFGIFTNTLTNKLIERIFSKGIVDPKAKSLQFGNGGIISSSSGGVAAAKERFASLGQVNLGTGGGIDILNDLSACPVDVTNVSATTLGLVSANNCVIDSSFRQAVEEHLTVQQALDRKLLSDQKVFGFDANGREPDFRSGYPFRSLKILRKYRVLPVGWDLAAQYIRDFERQNVNLGAIVQQFDNPDSPYYRLIDPTWVLKSPENICLRTGFSSDIISQEFVDEDGDEGGRKNIDYAKRYCNSDSDANVGKECKCTTDPLDPSTPCIAQYDTDPPGQGLCVKKRDDGAVALATCAFITPRQEQIQRREACVDERTCVLENDDGTCKQFGTCTEEKDTWRFNGQSCNNVYASCQTYTDSGGQSVSYLQNTLQPNSCGADNAGCQQYCTTYDYTAGKWSCTDATLPTATKRFDRDAQECDANAEGCTQFLRMTTGTNLAGNGGFEQSTVVNPAGNANFSGWLTGNGTHTCGAQTFASSLAFGGSQAARLQYLPDCTPSAQKFTTTIYTGTPIGGRTFTTSFYAKSEGASCSPLTQLGAGGWLGAAPALTITPDWQRYSYTTTVDSTRTEINFSLIFEPTDTCTYVLDNVQVEEGSQLTDYKDYGAVNQVHLKRPADGLACTGNVATDPPACSKFISKCTAADVGCDLFTPTAGGTAVPAKGGISCPADKAGCATFREQPTTGVLKAHDTRTGFYCKSDLPTKFTSCDPTLASACSNNPADCQPLVSFIAKTGTQCTATDVGCEAYTNLDQVAQGGEGKAQFTKLQLCVQPNDPGLKNYYSWVGDNESGYQLKQYRLKQSNAGSGPCTNLDTGQTLPLNCVDNTSPQTAVIDCQATFGTDPDCGQYYDDLNPSNVYYRLRSRLIEGTADCHPYRNTVDSNVYYADATKSLSCSAAAVGCREYVGNTGSNTRTILKSEFENGSSSPWVVSGNPTNPTTESITFGGHSLHVTTNAQATNQPLVQGKSYVLAFWAKSNTGANVDVEARLQNGSAVSMGTVSVRTDWNAYTLGPTNVSFATAGTNVLSVLGADFYIDNLVLTEISDSTYRIKASQTACGGFEGCQEYRNRSNVVNTYSGFSKLCKSEVVGCEALINTKNSTDAFASSVTFPSQRGDVDGSGKVDSADINYLAAYMFSGGPKPFPLEAGDTNADGNVNVGDVTALTKFLSDGTPFSSNPYPGDKVDTDADEVEFWVNDPTKACRAEEKGCRALGKENFDASGKLQNMETVYLRDNPDTYTTIMCGRGALFCEEYTLSEGGNAYFRNPGSKVCSYRDVSGNKSAGWYIAGTDTPCPVRELNNIPPAVPNGGYAGLCPAEQNGCGNFLDPLGTGASLTTNGNFEVANGSLPQGWSGVSASLQAYVPNNGSQAVRAIITNQGTFTQTVSLDANAYYVVSADVAKGSAAMTEDFRLGLVSCKNAQGGDAPVSSPDGSLFNDNTSTTLRIPADRFGDTAALRVSGRFFSGNAVTCNVIAGAVGGTTGYWLDNLQVNSTTNTSVIRQSVDSTSCNGQVGDKQGCRLFNDLSNATLAYDVDQSPIGGSPTDPDATGSPAACADHPELCDSNVLLKVQRDRQCSQWLTPTTTIESTKPNGQKENLTLGLATCDSFSPSGQCNHFVDEMRCSNNAKQTCVVDADCGAGVCKPMNFTGNTAAYSREDLRNKSGLVLAGLQWAGNQILNGKYLFGVAPQVGNDGVAVADDVLNGTFNKSKILSESGWTLQADSTTDGSVLALTTSQTLAVGNTTAPVTVNPFLQATPSIGGSRPTVIRTTTAAMANRLTPDRTYVLSFNIRYVQSPDRLLTDTKISAGIASSATAGIISTNAWYGNVKPTTQWQRFVIGPLTLSANATQAQGNTAFDNNGNSTHQPFDQSTGMVYFLVPSNNRTAIAIDDVSVLPVLNVDDPLPATTSGITGQLSNDAYIARSCRAYPNSTALSCGYQDDTGKRFDGWQGYCLEPDPRNPTGCLSWYPIDLLAGERNIFGRVEAAGYSGQNPLYMCLQSAGRGANISMRTVEETEDEGATWSYTVNGYSLNQVETIQAVVSAADGDWHPGNGTVLTMNRTSGQYYCDADNCPASSGTTPAWFVAGCGGQGSASDRKCNMPFTWSGMSPAFNASGCDDWDGSDDNTNLWGLRVQWPADPNTRTATINFGMCDASGGGGHYKLDIRFIVRDICQVVAQVVQPGGTNASWSNRTSSQSYPLPDLRYLASQDTAPYGAIVPPELHLEDPGQWDTRDNTVEPGKQGVYVMSATQDVRASSVYGCAAGGNCSRRICSITGSACNTLAEIATCTAAKGFCIGAGTAKVCQTGSKVSQACTTDAQCGTAGEKCDYGSTQNVGGGAFVTNKATSTGIAYLKLLFANVYGAWQLDEATQTYVDITATDSRITGWRDNYLTMPACGGVYDRAKANVVSSNQVALTNAYCGIPPLVESVKVGNRESGVTIIGAGELIQLQFNSIVDKEQLPMKNIAIDWDGDSNSDEIIRWNFAPRSNAADPHSFTHVYLFGQGTGQCFDKGTGKYGDKFSPDFNQAVAGKEYCIARPRVQIQDNWDWCNGGRCVNPNAPYSYSFPSTQSSYWEPLPDDIVIIR